MKIQFNRQLIAVLLFCLFSQVFSTRCNAQQWERKDWYAYQNTEQIGDSRIYLGSKYFSDSLINGLGTWEGENGTRVRIYVAKNPWINSTDERLLRYFDFWGHRFMDYTHVILADIECWSLISDDEGPCRKWIYINENGLLATFESERGTGSYIYEGSFKCNGEQNQFWHVSGNSEEIGNRIDRHPVIKFHVAPRIKGFSENRNPQLNHHTGDFLHDHKSQPSPLTKTSEGIIGLDETTSQASTPEKEYAIKIYNTPKRVKPDGESTVEITAILYEYTLGDENSQKRLAGKTINFVLDEYSEFKAGELSATTAVTDANGQARIIFTAPTGERLQEAPSLKLTSTVNAVCEEFDVEDKAYISYILDDGKVQVEPSPGIISSEGIVPPDKRFPALIKAYFEDGDLNPLINTKVHFLIDELSPVGMLRGPGGIEGTELNLSTDEQGWAEVQYYYAAEKQLSRPITETIKITSDQMATPLEAKITVGMNIIFDLVENAYEGKGELNAGEKIPIRVKIKLAEYPNLDLSAFFNYWGLDEKSGNTMLFVKLEIENISTVPKYLMDQLKLENYPDPGFSENMNVRSFKDKDVLNMLWMPEMSLEDYQGFPRVSPQTIGNHYYEARLTLTDQHGNEIFEADHPARKAYFNIQTGMAADWGQIFFVSNPFNIDSKDDQLMSVALNVLGLGSFLSLTDAMYMINTGDVDGLFFTLFSEVKGGLLNKAKASSAYHDLTVNLYTGMAIAEKVGLEILKDQKGPIAEMEEAIFNQLYSVYKWEPGQLVILRGFGDQKLFEEAAPIEKDKDAGKSNFALAISGSESKPTEESQASAKVEIPTTEGKYMIDEKRETSSLKNGYMSIYIIPADMKVSSENAIEMKRY